MGRSGGEGAWQVRRRSEHGDMASRPKRRAVGAGAPPPPDSPVPHREEAEEDDLEDEDEDDEDSDEEESDDDEVVDEVRGARDPGLVCTWEGTPGP